MRFKCYDEKKENAFNTWAIQQFKHNRYTYDSFDVFVFAVHSLDTKYMIAKVERFKSSLLAEQNNHGATCPMKTFTKKLPGNIIAIMKYMKGWKLGNFSNNYSLNSEFRFTHWYTVHKL